MNNVLKYTKPKLINFQRWFSLAAGESADCEVSYTPPGCAEEYTLACPSNNVL